MPTGNACACAAVRACCTPHVDDDDTIPSSPPTIYASPLPAVYGCGCPCAQVHIAYPAGTLTGCVSSSSTSSVDGVSLGRRHCRRGVMWYTNGNTYCGPWVHGSPDTTTSSSTTSLPMSGTKWFRGGDIYVGGWGGGGVGRNGYGVYTYAASEIVPLQPPKSDDITDELSTSSSPSSPTPIGIVVKAQYRGQYINDQPHDLEGVLITFEPTPVLYTEFSNFTSSSASSQLSSFIGVRSVYKGGFVGGRKEGTGNLTVYDSKTGGVSSSVVGGMWYQGKRISTPAQQTSSATTTGHRAAGTGGGVNAVGRGVPGTTLGNSSVGINPVDMTAPFMGEDPFGAVTAALEGMDARMAALEARLTSSTN